MTEIVVAVGSAADAVSAMAGGTDRMLVCLPGEPPPSAFAEIARAADGRCPLALWCGDDRPGAVAGSLQALQADSLFVRAGAVFAADAVERIRVIEVVSALSQAADPRASALVCDGTLLGEPWQGRRLLAEASIGDLAQQVRQARAEGRSIGFAGVPEMPDVPRLAALCPDFLVLDTLVRAGGDGAEPIDPARIRLVRSLVEDAGGDGLPEPAIVGRDRIFVRDWTVAIHLGAYAHEREPQRVRFTVEAEVAQAGRAADLRDVVTYDLITDAIVRATVTHVDLVETIAADVAAVVLAHRRVMQVDVTVEKLDLGPGALGCRIVRRRGAPA